MSVNWQDIAFSFLGGLGLFLFSIKYMGDGLQQAAGDKLRFYIDKYTSNPVFRGFDWYCHDGLDSVEFRGYRYCRRSGFGRAFESSSGYWYCHGGKHRYNRNFLHDWFQLG